MTTTTVFGSTNDGWVQSRNTAGSYATALAGDIFDTSTTQVTGRVGQQQGGSTYVVDQLFFEFDTSGLPDADTVSAVVFSLDGSSNFTTTDFNMVVLNYDWSSGGLTTADWRTTTQLQALTSLATFDSVGYSAAYMDFTSAGAAFNSYINKTGSTYFMVASDRNASATTPVGNEFLIVSLADATGTTTDPKLVITHAAGSSNQDITGSLYTDTDTFYASTVSVGAVAIDGGLFTNTNTFYGATLSATYAITGALVSDGDTFYASTVSVGPVAVSGALYSDPDTFYGATLARGAVAVTGALYTDPDTFYASTVSVGAVTVTGALYSDPDTFYGATLAGGIVTILGALFEDADAFYAATIAQDGAAQAITGALFQDGDTFYAATLTPGAVAIAGALFTDGDTFYGATVAVGTATILGALFEDGDTFYSATVQGPQAITGALFTNSNTFFESTVANDNQKRPRIWVYNPPAQPRSKAKGKKGRKQQIRDAAAALAGKPGATREPITRKVTEAAVERVLNKETVLGELFSVDQAVSVLPEFIQYTPPPGFGPSPEQALVMAITALLEQQAAIQQDEDEVEMLLLMAAA